MTNAKFSPGPWRWSVDGEFLDCPGDVVLQCRGLEVKPADARLIAAAPEMYARLRRVLESSDRYRTAWLDDGQCVPPRDRVMQDIADLLQRIDSSGA